MPSQIYVDLRLLTSRKAFSVKKTVINKPNVDRNHMDIKTWREVKYCIYNQVK